MAVIPTTAAVADSPPRRPRHRPRRRTVVLGTVVTVMVAALAVYLVVQRPRTTQAAEQAPAELTAQVATATFEQSVATSGTLTPAVQEDVAFTAAGTVTQVSVSVGDTVQAGDTLAVIDTLQLEAARAAARADLAEAQAALADARESDDGSSAATARVTAEEAAVAVAQAAADRAEAAMSDATLTAPVAGLVTDVGLAVGDVVPGSSSGSSGAGGSPAGTGQTGGTDPTSSTDSSAGVTIVGTDSWTVDVTVPESQISRVAVGDQVEMTSDDLDGTVFGTVSTVGRLPSTSSGAVAYPVTIAVTGSPEGLYDGVAVDVSIVYERRTDVLSVPAAAVSADDDGRQVVTVVGDDGTRSEVPVETGETSGTLVEITSGLTAGDTVAYTPVLSRGDTGNGEGGAQLPGTFDFDPSQLPGGFSDRFPGGGGQGGPGGGAVTNRSGQ